MIDSSYLGPPGRYIAVMRYKVIFLWLIFGPATFWILRRLGVHFTLLSVGLTAIGVTAVVLWLADRITPERSFGALVRQFWTEVTAPRPIHERQESSAPDLRVVGRPLGGLQRWAEQRDARVEAERREQTYARYRESLTNSE